MDLILRNVAPKSGLPDFGAQRRIEIGNRRFRSDASRRMATSAAGLLSYSMANLEWNVPNRPTTKFRIGSITKQFTAAATLLLESGAS
jgi:CubicO group peptidase (beta-lactamase class C family)